MKRRFGANLDDLVYRAKEGRVTKAEVAEVARLLPVTKDGERAYKLLYVIARTSATEYERLVASYLDYEQNPMLARLALQTLCRFWNFTDRYVDQLERFLGDVEWDFMGDVRLIAISASGEYLRDNVHCGLLRRLLEISEQSDSTAQLMNAIESIARALGDPMQEVLSAGGVGWEGWSAAVRERGRARLAAECE